MGRLAFAIVLPMSALLGAQQRPVTVDAFESTGGWSARTPDGATLRLSSDSGYRGRSIRLDFDFGAASAPALIRRAVNLALPPNYEITLRHRGEISVVGLQVRLIDQSGEHVLSAGEGELETSRVWTELVRKKRQFSMTRGSRTDIGRATAIEIAIVPAASGGRGTLWIDELQLRPREADQPYTLTPRLSASSEATGFESQHAMDGDAGAGWRSGARDTSTVRPPARSGSRNAPVPLIVPPNASGVLAIDFLRARELGGLIVDWEPDRHATAYTVDLSTNGRDWENRYRVTGGNGGRDYIPLPGGEARFVRLVMMDSAGSAYGIREITVAPVEWSASRNVFFAALARAALPGSYPKYLSGLQTHWTAAGADGDDAEVVINAEGMVETRSRGVSIEPFVYLDDTLFTWRDAKISQSLASGRFPEPSVTWDGGDWSLTLLPVVVAGPADSSVAYLQYRIANRARSRRAVRLYLAVRPFQVVAPGQLDGRAGGVAPIRDLAVDNQVVRVNGEPTIVSLTPPAGFGAVPFDQDNVVDYLRRGRLPPSPNVTDHSGFASGALAYGAQVDSGNAAVVEVAIPLHVASLSRALSQRDLAVRAPRDRTADTRRAWRDAIERVTIDVPTVAARTINALYANVGYMLVNRDHAAPRAGSRDGAPTRLADAAPQAAALLRLGRPDVARALLDWYARHQLPSGNVPCCVGDRGADAFPEHDSHGAFIALAAEHWRHTLDRELLDRLWPNVARAAAYIDSLRRRQMTAEYQTGDKRVFHGILPAAQHRALDAVKPAHLYRDNFIALRGLNDAVEIARVLSRPEETGLATARDGLRRDLQASIQLAMVQRGIDFLPGSAERADFDPMTTFTAVMTGVDRSMMPETIARGFDRTIERYWEELSAKIAGTRPWDAYAGAELRSVSTLLRLGQRPRAHAALDWFLKQQPASGWHIWADSVRRDSALGPTGDMPNSTVGAAFITAILDMFAYERDADSSLVVAAGVPESWVNERPGVTVRRLSTHYGQLSFTMRRETNAVRISMQAGLRMPPGGIVVHSPLAVPARQSLVNGIAMSTSALGAVVVRTLPAEVVFRQ